MRPGILDRRVTIEEKSVARDAMGGEVVTWVTLADRISAQVQDVLPSKNESVQQGMAVAINQTRIRLRWRSDVDSTMRVIYHSDAGDVIYQIIGGPAEIWGRKGGIEIMCEKFSVTGR